MPKKVADGAVRALVQAACESVVVNSSAMWGIIPSERYPALRDKYLGDSAHDSMRAVTDRHWRVMRNIKELVRREQERSVEFYNICGCGKRLAPIAASDSLTSDTIVPTYSASMGAQCARPDGRSARGAANPLISYPRARISMRRLPPCRTGHGSIIIWSTNRPPRIKICSISLRR